MDQALKDALNQILGSRAVLVLTQIAVGVGLMYVIDKFFKFVEEKLTDDTKLEIAVWLLGVKVGQKLEPWPETFAKVFDRLFGSRHISWKCFGRSILSSYTLGVIALFVFSPEVGPTTVGLIKDHHLLLVLVDLVGMFLIINALPDYISLLKTRWLLERMRSVSLYFYPAILLLDLIITVGLSFVGYLAYLYFARVLYALLVNPNAEMEIIMPNRIIDVLPFLLFIARKHPFVVFPAFFTSIWLWLYAGSGFLLKFARRFDIGFEWFNRKFDIEKRPLQCIGLVSGVLVALVYWTAVVVHRILA